ncbi:poly(A) RNA polymerase, mitochondrial-like isoform X2 [Trichoplusia ni]|uniref:Poly(A) RNA polymerase, mitochondrial-like isoform X2 n=1 Tax=Trichoplusia ni TaxID=7111 RepID=A0A7E5VPQ9_TRINI|nr:poly(A) RNA polymerase, mitochondrial-like isoform X2 [Trichoplusia ni]
MSVLFQTLVNKGKIHLFRNLLKSTPSSCKCLLVRKHSDGAQRFVSFDEVVAQRRAEARRSIVVQVNSEASFNELYGYCSKYATIAGVHHYKNTGGEHFMLIEFSSEDNLKEIIKSCSTHQKDLDVMALNSPFLWFRAASGKKEVFKTPSMTLSSMDGCSMVDEDELFQELLKCDTVSDQIQLLYDRTKLNDLGIRLRYMVARQVECVFESLYANIAVRPFGSSVNGFGKMGCDLDLVLTNTLTEEMSSAHKRLVFQDKRCEGGRSPRQRHMESVAELLELRVPGAARLQRILHARVPIVKFAHDYTDLDCDLCYNNMSGVHMSSLLWSLGGLDARVRPLTFAVRRWAQAAALTNPHPGRWITNFPLTLMVLFFLQNTPGGCVLPTVKTLVQRAGKEDVRIAEENLNCTFLRDMNKLPPECYSQNKANLQTLLLQFFEFYSQFNFQDKAISINEGTAIRKPNSLPLYVVNPLEQALNVSRNVSYEECERLKLEVRNAAWQLEAGLEGQKNDDWGVLGLVERKTTRGLKKLLRVGNSHRLVSVKDLFNDTEESVSKETLKNKLERLTPKSDTEIEKNVKEMKDTLGKDKKDQKEQKVVKMKFKNNQIASEVFRIRRDKIL